MRRIFLVLAVMAAPALPAANYTWIPGEDVVGTERFVRTRHEDTLLDLARRNGFGYDELRLANPTVDPWLPGEGTTVVLPGRFILPAGPREGLVINLEEQRLYYFPAPPPPDKAKGKSKAKGKAPPPAPRQVITFPVSVGREGLDTPLGTTTVEAKVENPVWYPGESIRREHEDAGDPLPRSVPPGPDNPLGPLAMKLGLPGVFIHGTNKPYGIGMQVTHGCMRLYPEDIEALMPLVPRGTVVRIVRQPWKTGWKGGVLYFETHTPPADPVDDMTRLQAAATAALGARADYEIDWVAAEVLLRRARGTAQPLFRVTATGG